MLHDILLVCKMFPAGNESCNQITDCFPQEMNKIAQDDFL